MANTTNRGGEYNDIETEPKKVEEFLTKLRRNLVKLGGKGAGVTVQGVNGAIEALKLL